MRINKSKRAERILLTTACVLILAMVFGACSETEKNGESLPPPSKYYVHWYFDPHELSCVYYDHVLLDSGVYITNEMITNSIVYTNLAINPFSHGMQYYYDHREWNLYHTDPGFQELAARYGDTNYYDVPAFKFHPCIMNPVERIDVYCQPAYAAGYEGKAINALVNIAFADARLFVENGYSFEDIEEMYFSDDPDHLKTDIMMLLTNFNARSNYLLGLGIGLQPAVPPDQDGEYTFTIVYRETEESGGKVLSNTIGPIEITRE